MYKEISEQLGVKPEQIVRATDHGEQTAYLVNFGIGGIKRVWVDNAVKKTTPVPIPEMGIEINATGGAESLAAEMDIEINATGGAESLAAEMGLELLDIQKWFGVDTRITVKHVRKFMEGN